MLYRSFFVVLALIGSDVRASSAPGEVLFGQPNAHTGLSDAQCRPTCDCGGQQWTPPTYTDEDFASLREWTITNPPALTMSNPYDEPPPRTQDAHAVCAFVREPGAAKSYRLETFASAERAQAVGAKVTHTGSCGACSTLEDLAVYLSEPELGNPVRRCGLSHLTDSMEEHVECLEDIGFTRACAQIWYYNTIHTRNMCFGVCIALMGAPHNQPSGELNACLQCDEDNSGAVFKSVAGRTRRNTGMASAICRPCREVFPIEHHYE